MPLLGTRGAASAQGFGEFAQSAAPVYIEDVFSTYLYAGTAASLTINNGIDLSGKGGAVWGKNRTTGSTDHWLYDTVRGFGKPLTPNSDAAQADNGDFFGVKQFNANGFDIAANDSGSRWNSTSNNYVTWTFREQSKFFDIVTWTGNNDSTRQISHNLGSLPGCIMVKCISATTTNWLVSHRGSTGSTGMLNLNNANGQGANGFNGYVSIPGSTWAYGTAADTTSTFFTVAADGSRAGDVNQSGRTYVAYLFAHDAGGFGTSGTDNVISCGSYTGNGSATGPIINLGYEPQWILIKRTDTSGQYWCMWDNMRGIVTGGNDPVLYPNVSDAENTGSDYLEVNATGFQLKNTFTAINASGSTYIYIAIRRGPMKTPTTGASVFEPAFSTANSPEYKSNTVTSGFDTAIAIYRPGYSDVNFSYPYVATRMQPTGRILQTSRTNAEYNYSAAATFAWNTGWFNSTFGNDTNRESYMFKRAPGFHDLVCYTGTGSATTQAHNLGVAPELMIVRSRNNDTNWFVYSSAAATNKRLFIDQTWGYDNANTTDAGIWNNTAPTATQFSIGGSANISTWTYIAYLFASVAGVSKVGTYSGTGADQTINCGFPSGVRFVLIKRTDTTGGWFVYDTTRGMTTGTDPYILLNSVAAEVTGTNYVETVATGFKLIGSNSGTNANGGTYLYLAIA